MCILNRDFDQNSIGRASLCAGTFFVALIEKLTCNNRGFSLNFVAGTWFTCMNWHGTSCDAVLYWCSYTGEMMTSGRLLVSLVQWMSRSDVKSGSRSIYDRQDRDLGTFLQPQDRWRNHNVWECLHLESISNRRAIKKSAAHKGKATGARNAARSQRQWRQFFRAREVVEKKRRSENGKDVCIGNSHHCITIICSSARDVKLLRRVFRCKFRYNSDIMRYPSLIFSSFSHFRFRLIRA